MRCRSAHILITKSNCEALDAREGEALARHLEGCAGCRAEREADRRLEALIAPVRSAAAASTGVPPARFTQRMGERSPAAWRRGVPLMGLAAAGAAAVAALALLPGLWHRVPNARLAGGLVPAPSAPLQPGEKAGHPGVALRHQNRREQSAAPRMARAVPPVTYSSRRWREPSAEATHRSAPDTAPQPPRPVPADNRSARRPAAVPDSDYLNGHDAPPAGFAPRATPIPPARLAGLRDDFITVPPIRYVSIAPGAVVDAERIRKQEAAKVDPRLFQKVTLHLKAASLEDLCRQMSAATGVALRAARGVGDEKVTALVEDRPARDIMRAVARLFDYQWERTGEPGAYRYELRQDLLSQLAEQVLRNRDLQAALLDVDRQMKAYAPYLDQTPDQLKEREKTASDDEKSLIGKIDGAGWGGLQLYNHLSPTELSSLANGQELAFGAYGNQPDQSLPDVWRTPLLSVWGDQAFAQQGDDVFGGSADALRGRGLDPVRIAGDPSARLTVKLKLNRSELGQLSLETEAMVEVQKGNSQPGFGTKAVLATGRSPSTARPNNGLANRALRGEPGFQRVVSFHPKPGCRDTDSGNHGRVPTMVEAFDELEALPSPHVSAADVWEEVHRVTGMPIVADAYTHLHPLAPVTVEQRPLFDALCQVGDVMHVRWRWDGKDTNACLLARSTSYFWDKLKEVPDRFLERWRADRARNGGLPFDALIEMASQSDAQLDSLFVRQGITHCWELPEWRLVSAPLVGGMEFMRPYARIIAGLGAAQQREMQAPQGIPFTALSLDQQREFLRLVKPRLAGPPAEVLRQLQADRIRADYVPAGQFVWRPVADRKNPVPMQRLPVISGKTAEEALAAARKLWPTAAPGEIQRTPGGVFTITVLWPEGNAFSFGARPISWR